MPSSGCCDKLWQVTLQHTPPPPGGAGLSGYFNISKSFYKVHMIYIQRLANFYCFGWLFGWPPSPYGVGTMKRSHDQLVIKRDAQSHDLLSFLKQNVIRKLLVDSHHWGLLPSHPEVVAIVIKDFNLGLQPHNRFANLVELVQTCQASVRGFPLSGPWSHHIQLVNCHSNWDEMHCR